MCTCTDAGGQLLVITYWENNNITTEVQNSMAYKQSDNVAKPIQHVQYCTCILTKDFIEKDHP